MAIKADGRQSSKSLGSMACWDRPRHRPHSTQTVPAPPTMQSYRPGHHRSHPGSCRDFPWDSCRHFFPGQQLFRHPSAPVSPDILPQNPALSLCVPPESPRCSSVSAVPFRRDAVSESSLSSFLPLYLCSLQYSLDHPHPESPGTSPDAESISPAPWYPVLRPCRIPAELHSPGADAVPGSHGWAHPAKSRLHLSLTGATWLPAAFRPGAWDFPVQFPRLQDRHRSAAPPWLKARTPPA